MIYRSYDIKKTADKLSGFCINLDVQDIMLCLKYNTQDVQSNYPDP
jgi:hypothetical protein